MLYDEFQFRMHLSECLEWQESEGRRMSLKVLVIGAGGVGGYFGGRLAAAGNDVTFVARGRHLAAMQCNGLTLLSSLGDVRLPKVRAVDNVAQAGTADFVFVTVKLWDTEPVAKQLIRFAQSDTAVISFQNGVRKDQLLSKYLPTRSIMGGISYISAAIEEPGTVRHFGPIRSLVFGELDKTHSPRSEALRSACEKADIVARISDDIEREIWEKFVFLVGLSGVTTTMRQPIGRIRSNPRTRAFLLEVMRETVRVGQAKNIALLEGFAEDRLAFCDTLPAEMFASMYHDLIRGNRLELPWLSGAVADLAEQMEMPAPCNKAITDILALYVNGTNPDGSLKSN